MRRRSPPRGPVPARPTCSSASRASARRRCFAAWSSQAGEMTVLETAGVESEADLPYAALIDVLQPVLHRLDALPEAQAVALSTALALGPPGVVDRFAVGVATLGLLGGSGRRRPGADRRRRSAMGRLGVPRRALVRSTASHWYPRDLRRRSTGRRGARARLCRSCRSARSTVKTRLGCWPRTKDGLRLRCWRGSSMPLTGTRSRSSSCHTC